MRQTPTLLMWLLGFALLAIHPAHAENWPQWRGPNNDGISTATDVPRTWSKTENVAWRLPLPGPAGSTPVIWEDRIFLTSASGEDLVLMCISTDGSQLWSKQVSTGNRDANRGEGNSASPSPSTDGEHVWSFFGVGDLACHTVDGEEVWKFDVQDRYGEFDIQFGMASTPVLYDGALYLQLIHGTMRGSDYTVGKVIKLDAATGEEIWAVDRNTDASFECKHSYASPFIYNDGTTSFLVTHGADCTAGFDLTDGTELWRLNGLNGPSVFNDGRHDPTFRFVASPLVVPGSIVIPTAKRGPVVTLSVDPQMSGDITQNEQVVNWSFERTPDVCIPLIHEGLVYLADNDGQLTCLDLKTGEQLYRVRTHTAQHRASPVLADGHLYWPAKDGVTSVIKAGPEFELVADNDIGEPIASSPVLIGNRLYLRSFDALYAIEN